MSLLGSRQKNKTGIAEKVAGNVTEGFIVDLARTEVSYLLKILKKMKIILIILKMHIITKSARPRPGITR